MARYRGCPLNVESSARGDVVDLLVVGGGINGVGIARDAAGRGLKVIIAGAGGAAHLPGVTAAMTPLPVIGVPIAGKFLKGEDSLYSIVQMPSGVPVATVAIGGARNAGLLAVQILAVRNPALQQKYLQFKDQLAEESRAKNRNLAL